jgi:adenylate kinase
VSRSLSLALFFSSLVSPPSSSYSHGILQVTGEPLIQRADDNEAVLQKRLITYHRDTAPLVDYYKRKNILTTLHAEKKADEV